MVDLAVIHITRMPFPCTIENIAWHQFAHALCARFELIENEKPDDALSN